MQYPDAFPISKIKIRVPHRRHDWIARDRLLEALHDDLDKQLLLIVAPAGYGKTTLLVDFAHNSELPVCWLALDVLDKEPQRFLAYLVSSIAENYPEFGKDAFAAMEGMKSFEQDGEHILIALSNEIEEKIGEHFVVILDDYHIVGDVLIIQQLLSRLLQLTGEHFHLILASRNLPDIPDISQLVIRNLVGGLSYEEMAFQPKEVQKLFLQENRATLSLHDAETLVSETEGWIAAIQLSGGQPGNLSKVDPLRSTRELFDFFSKEVLARQPRNIQRFLLMTSFLDHFDVTLCEDVLNPLLTDEDDIAWASLFEIVRRENLFSILVDDDGRWMRYHHLFQHFLRSRLRYTEPALAWHIQQNLARAYEKREAWEEALQIYAELDDNKNLSRLLSQTGSVFIRGGRVLTLASWLDRLTTEIIYSEPAILSLQGIVYASIGETAKAIKFYKLAEEKLRAVQNQSDLALTLARRAEAYRHLGQFDQALADAEEALLLSKGNTSTTAFKIAYTDSLRIKGLSFFGQGHLKKALFELHEALHACRLLGLTSNIPILETELGVIYRRLGDPDTAARYYDSALKVWKDTGNTGWKARLLNNLGLLYHMTGEIDKALPLLDEALEVAQKSGYIWLQTNEFISLGDLWTDIGDFEIAHEYYDQALTSATQLGDSLLIFYATLGEARLKRLQGEFSQALVEYEQTEINQVKLGLYEQALLYFESGTCLVQYGNTEQGVEALEQAINLLDQNLNEMEQASARLWMIIAIYEKDTETALSLLNELLPVQKNWSKATPLMINAGRIVDWIKRTATIDVDDLLVVDFFQQAEKINENLSKFRIELQQVATKDEKKTTLEFCTFGNVRAYKNGRELKVSDWQTREAKELFFFLLQSPPITKEKIGLVFWPDITPARLKMRFKINIYRIRQALGQDVLLFDAGQYYFNKTLSYKWDREQFDNLIKTAEKASNRYQLLEQALAVVHGFYMADLHTDWADSDRFNYQEIIQQTMVELTEYYLQSGQISKSLQFARQIIENDSLVETGHRLLLQVYAALHDQVNLIRHYQEYERALSEELGIQPSSSFLALYNELIQNI